MFVVEVGAALTTVFLVRDIFIHAAGIGFSLQIALWLWFTVLFANFAEAMAEARGKAQADTLRKTKTDSMAKRIVSAGQDRNRPRLQTARRGHGDLRGGRHHPRRRRSDRRHRHRGRIGHHRRKRARDPRIGRRPQRCDRRNQGSFRPGQDSNHLQPRRNISGPHDRAGGRRRAAENSQRDRAEHPDCRVDAHLPAGRRHPAAVFRLRRDLRRSWERFPAWPCWFRCWSA